MPRDRDDRDDDDRRRYDDDDRPRGRRRRDDDDDYDRPPPKSGGALKVVLIVLAVVGIVVVVAGVGLFFAVSKVREAAARMAASNNQKQVGLALLNYDSANGKLPGPFVDTNLMGMPPPANPSDRLSWRVEILPYIEQEYLYQGIQRHQAWNSSVNQPFTSKPVKTYCDPNDPTDANTRYRCFYDNGALFSTNPKDRVSWSGVTDGTSNTIMFAESGERVPWAQFNEWAFDPSAPPPTLGHPTRDGFLVAMADGSVRFIKKTVSPASLNAAITRAGGDAPGADFK